MKIEHLPHDQFVNALLSGLHKLASQIISDLVKENESIQDIYEKVIRKSMYKIGDLWEKGSISISSEHLSSAIVQSIQNELYPNILTNNKDSGTTVVTCVENEQHQIGIKMVADMFEINGCNTYFLGSGMPTGDLISFMKTIQPDTLALSATLHFNLLNLEKTIQEIRKEMPELIILIGGQALQKGNYEHLLEYGKVFYIKDLYAIDAYLTERTAFTPN